jgi:hypothetical protein
VTLSLSKRIFDRYTLDCEALRAKYLGGNMQDLVNRLQSAQELTQQLLERL